MSSTVNERHTKAGVSECGLSDHHFMFAITSYKTIKGRNKHVKLLRAHVKLLREHVKLSRRVHAKLLRAHVKLLRAQVKDITCYPLMSNLWSLK